MHGDSAPTHQPFNENGALAGAVALKRIDEAESEPIIVHMEPVQQAAINRNTRFAPGDFSAQITRGKAVVQGPEAGVLAYHGEVSNLRGSRRQRCPGTWQRPSPTAAVRQTRPRKGRNQWSLAYT